MFVTRAQIFFHIENMELDTVLMMCLCGVSQETDTAIVDQSQKKSIYCTDVLFLFLFIGFSGYAVSVMDY